MTHNIKKRNIKKAIAAFAISGAILAAAHAPRFYQPDEISTDLFLSSNHPIVEITTGTVCNAETGDDEIQNTTETEYNYISYKDVDGIENGSKVLTFFYYSKNAQDVDDICIHKAGWAEPAHFFLQKNGMLLGLTAQAGKPKWIKYLI